MAVMVDEDESKAEPATWARLSRAASDGDAPGSTEAVTFAALAAALAALVVSAPTFARRLTEAGARIFVIAGQISTTADLEHVLWTMAHASLVAILLVGMGSIAGALVVTGMQTRFRVRKGQAA